MLQYLGTGQTVSFFHLWLSNTKLLINFFTILIMFQIKIISFPFVADSF